MMILICSPVELRERVGAVIPSGVDRFVSTVGLNLAEEQEVPLMMNYSETLETPKD